MNIGTAFIDAVLDLNPLKRGFATAKKDTQDFADQTERSAKEATGAWGRVGSSVTGMFKSAKSAASDFFKGLVQGAGMAAFNQLVNLGSKAVSGFKDALFGLNGEAENTAAKIQAFTKDAGMTAEILAKVRKEAASTPFSFQQMAGAMGSLLPVAKAAGVGIDDLVKQAEVLAASNPMQGLEGAAYALKSAMGGDFASIIDRFDLNRTTIQKLKDEGVPNLEIVRRAMLEMGYDESLVSGMAETMGGRWSTFLDSLDGFKIALTKPAFDALKHSLVVAQEYVDANTDSVTKLAAAIGDKFGLAINAATKRLPSFIAQIGDAWKGFKQIRDAILDSSFSSDGPFSEDSPLIVGIFAVQNGLDKGKKFADDLADALDRAGTKFDGLLAKADALIGKIPGLSKVNLSEGAKTVAASPTAQTIGAGALGGLAGAGALAGLAAMAPMLTHIMPILSVLPAVLGALVSPLGIILALVGAVGAAWVMNLGGIQEKTAAVIPAVTGFFTETLGPALTEVWTNKILPAWESAKPVITDTFNGIVTAAGDLWAGVQPHLQRFADYWTNDLQPRIAVLGETFGPAFATVSSAVSGFVTTILPGLISLGDGLRDIGAVALPILAIIGTKIVDSIGPAVGAITDFAAKTVPLVASAFANVLSIVGPIVNTIASTIGSVLSSVAGFISEHKTTIVTLFTSAWDFISGLIKLNWDIISGVITVGLKVLSGDWSGAWAAIQETGRKVWDDIKGLVSSGWTFIKTEFSLATEVIKTTAGNAWDAIQTKLASVGESIKTAILSPFHGARDAIGGVMTAFKDNLLGPLRSALSGFGTFGGGVAGVVNWILGAFKQPQIGVPSVPALAKGTRDFQGGVAMVGEQGPELVVLPKHAIVVPNGLTESLVANGGIPGFAGGLNLPSLFDIIKGGKDWLLQQAMNAFPQFNIPTLPGVMQTAAGAFFNQVKVWLGEMVGNFISTALPVSAKQVQDMIHFAESHVGEPYTWGGGHGAPGFDCSGFVAAVLDAGGIPNPHGIVTAFYEWMNKGRNGVVDIGVDNPYAAPDVQHMGVGLLGQWYEAGGRAGGVGRTSDYFSNVGSPPGFNTKAKAAGAWDKIDFAQSLKNMARGGAGQWAAFADGGLLNEKVLGIGVETGARYLLGEAGKEFVIPASLMPQVMAYFEEVLATGEVSNRFLVGIPLELREGLKRVAAAYIAHGSWMNHAPPTLSGGGFDATTFLSGLPPVLGGSGLPAPEFANAGPGDNYHPGGADALPPTSSGSGSGSGGPGMVRVQIEETIHMPDGKTVVRVILTDPVAVTELTDAVTDKQADEIGKAAAPAGGGGRGAW